MKLHQIFIWCKNAIYTTLPRRQATFSHTLIWCFQHLCEDAIVVLISQRRVLSLRDVKGLPHAQRCDTEVPQLVGAGAGTTDWVSYSPAERLCFYPSLYLQWTHQDSPLENWHHHLQNGTSCLKQAHLPQPHIPRHPLFHLACHCCPIYSNHISNVEGCFH